MTPNVDFVAILPELLVVATLVAVLLTDLWISEPKRWVLTAGSGVGIAVSFAATAVLFGMDRTGELASSSFVVDEMALFTKLVLLASAGAVVAMGAASSWKGEYLTLVLGVLLGAMALVSARDLVAFIVAFELLALPGYLLTAWKKKTGHASEASIKYFLLGAVATSLMLYGASLVFGITNATNFNDIAVSARNSSGDSILVLGVVLLLIGVAFKIAAAPFHFWTPDAYQGAPVPVAAFLSVVSKIAGLVALYVLATQAVPSESAIWVPLLATLAAVSIVVGNVAALRQTDLVRMLAYSSIAQSGYALVPIALARDLQASNSQSALESLLMFVAIFAVSNLAVFAALVGFGEQSSYDSLRNMVRRAPLAAVAMVVGLVSLAGLPPFAGWFAKLVIFAPAIESATTVGIVLAIAVAIGTAVGLFYYATVIGHLWRSSDAAAVVSPKPVVVLMLSTTLIIGVLGVLPGLLTGLVDGIAI